MRILNRLGAMLVALLMLLGGLLLAVEASMIPLGRPPVLVPRSMWHATLSNTLVGDSIVLIGSACLLAVGVLLLVFQLWPWRPVRLPARQSGWYLRRRAAQRSVAGAVAELASVSAVRTRLGRKWRLRVRATADTTDRDTVRETAVAELERLEARDTGRLRVRLTRRRVV